MEYDVVVIGSGPGGYIAAIRCAQLGMKTAIIEKYDSLGGTCLNVGCIPSKALLDSTEHFITAKNDFKEHGIELTNLKADLPKMISRKEEVVNQTTQGVSFLMKKNKIKVIHGTASFVDKNTISISSKDGKKTKLTGSKFIIATGSKPATLPFIKLDKKRIITSTEALKLKQIPKHLIIIGGGVIGMELGSVYARLGSKVSVIEFLDSIIPAMDKTMGKELQKSLQKLDFDFYLKHKVYEVSSTSRQVTVKAEGAKGEKVEIKGDYCLVSVGRRPYTDNLGLDKAGIGIDKQGKIIVNERLQTKNDTLYAIGYDIEW